MDATQCRKPVDRLVVTLSQRVRMRVSDEESFVSERAIAVERFDGVAARESTHGLTKALTLDLSKYSHKITANRHLMGDEMVSAERLQPTVMSQHSEIEYVVRVEAQVKGSCHTNPCTSHALVLIPAPRPSFTATESWLSEEIKE